MVRIYLRISADVVPLSPTITIHSRRTLLKNSEFSYSRTLFRGLKSGTLRAIFARTSSFAGVYTSVVLSSFGNSRDLVDGLRGSLIAIDSWRNENGVEGVNQGGPKLVHRNRFETTPIVSDGAKYVTSDAGLTIAGSNVLCNEYATSTFARLSFAFWS